MASTLPRPWAAIRSPPRTGSRPRPSILDDLLARRTVGRRPAALSDDLDWILAASGRTAFDDNRLPLIG